MEEENRRNQDRIKQMQYEEDREKKQYQEEKEKQEKEYEAYVKTKTPTANLPFHMLKAFLVGGCICVLGQLLLNQYMSMGIEESQSGTWTSITLIGFSVILTGFNIYPKMATWGGAGALVPITGFANSVVSPAIEYAVEGAVSGIGTRIFVIAGPVILYGTFISWALGILYYLINCFGFM